MHHPVLLTLVRANTRKALHSKGHRLRDAIELAALVDDNILDQALENSPAEVQQRVGELTETDASPRAIGDGSLIKLLTDFLASDLGKTLIALILSLIGA